MEYTDIRQVAEVKFSKKTHTEDGDELKNPLLLIEGKWEFRLADIRFLENLCKEWGVA